MVESLVQSGIKCAPTQHSVTGIELVADAKVAATTAFTSGWCEIQGESSQVAAMLVDARPGMVVSDYCAGAGGKTLALAATMGGRGTIVASDVDDAKLLRALVRFKRAGVHNVERLHLTEGGYQSLLSMRGGSCDRVLVDAPCSGTGRWASAPDVRIRADTAATLAQLAREQDAILEKAHVLVKPEGGRLLYATCSLLHAENQERVAAFLKRHPNFALRSAREVWQSVSPTPWMSESDEFLIMTSARHGTDGFFAAILERHQ